jgi:ABC-type branched-subunit amino acid transport system permease subunit
MNPFRVLLFWRPGSYLRQGVAALRLMSQPVTAPTGRFFGAHQSLSVIVGMSIVTALLPFIILLPPFSGFNNQTSFVDGFSQAGVWVLLAVGLNVVVGLAGLLDLGYAAFFAIGAYTYAYGSSPFSHNAIPFWPMLLVGAAVAAIFGLLLGAPTLRLRGDYLAIVTLGFGEIVPVVFNNSDTYTNGTNGITALGQPTVPFYTSQGFDLMSPFGSLSFGFGNPVPYYITVAAIIAIAMCLLYRLQDSRLGRAWMAVREDELAAASMGINTVTTKLLAFAIGASTSGLAGAYLSSKLAIVSPSQFGFTVSFTVLAMVVLGGMGNIWGVAAGAFIIYEIQSQGLKQLNVFFQGVNLPAIHLGFLNIDLSTINFLDYQYLLYGLALVGMMLLRPEGLFPSRRRRAELHDVDDAGAANQEITVA